MSLPDQLLTEIEAALGASVVPSLTTSSAWDDLYEAYLFSIVIEAARAEGAQVTFRSRSSANSSIFVCRTSPGYLGSSARDYGYAEIQFAGLPTLEAHLGVRISGCSQVLHECDISVLLKDEANLCRSRFTRIAPRSSKVIIAIEAKCYVTADIGLNRGREFLGLLSDISAENCYFVINCSSVSVEKLLARKKKNWEHNIVPGNTNAVNRLKAHFQTAFKDFIAKQ